jgi:uncharacterized membrane protein YfcA
MIPVMVIIFTNMGYSEDIAVKLSFGTNLFVILFTAIGSSLAHHLKRAVWWRAAAILGVGSAVGALIGATITSQFISGGTIKIAYGGLVIIVCLGMILLKQTDIKGNPRQNLALWLSCGFSVGIISGLMGIGGGVLLVPLMIMVLNFRMHQAVGTSTGIMLFTSAAGVIGYVINGLGVEELPSFSIGYINLPAWIYLTVTSVIATQIGVRLAHRLPAKQLRWVFIAIMFYIGLKMVGLFEWLGWPL